MSVEYNRLFRYETQIAENIIRERMKNNGTYVPSSIVKNRFILIAVDNMDFMEDTSDGKNTTHATVIAA